MISLKHDLLRSLVAAAVLAGPLAGICPGETIAQYKTGIDLTLSGARGSSWEIEYFYHDPRILPRKVVYLKDSTSVGFSRNARNSYRSGGNGYRTLGGNEGVIRFKVDGNMNRLIHWAGPNKPTAYTGPFTFSSLHYGLYGDPAVPVVGTSGPKPGIVASSANKSSYYWRGILDSAGDEWHTLSVGDDDTGFVNAGNGTEWQASDGVVILFVVNPKTPCLTISASGGAEFYTTPAKTYWVPKIHDQTSYIDPNSGDIDITLKDINGNNVFYRINGGDFVNAGSSSVTLDDSDFNNGTNTLQYYYAGNESHTKTRKVVKNPGFPSATVNHGDRFWGGAGNWPGIKAKIDQHNSWWIEQWGRDSTHNDLDRIASFGQGKRSYVGQLLVVGSQNALMARYHGADAEPANRPLSWGDYSLKSLLEASSTIDPLGFEVRHSGNATPSMEFSYRGYYDVNDFLDAAFTYDIVAGYYREDQHPGGMTPIEDLLIRDLMAHYVHLALLEMAGSVGSGVIDEGGMWDTSRKVGAFAIMCAMPNYSTPYLGTSGLDGSQVTYPRTPFQDDQYTWKQLFVDNNVTLSGWPNVAKRFGVHDYMLDSDGNFADRVNYTDTHLMGHCFNVLGNLWKLFAPQANLANLEAFFNQSADGDLMGLKDNSGPSFRANAGIQNSFFPYARNVGRPVMESLSATDGQSRGKVTQRGGPLYVVWYDHNLAPGESAAPPVSIPLFSPRGGTYETEQAVTISSTTPGATIHFTTDGTAPDTSDPVYAAPIAVSSFTVLRAVAVLDGQTSGMGTASYTIGSIVQTPAINVSRGTFLNDPVSVSISTGTSGAAVYYTIDGSVPTTASLPYTGPFVLPESATVRAVAVKAGSEDSLVAGRSVDVNSFLSNENWRTVEIPAQTGQFEIRFELIPTSDEIDGVVALSAAPMTAYAEGSALMRANPAGEFDAWKDTWYRQDRVVPYIGEGSYDVTMNVNIATEFVSVSVDSGDGSPVNVIDGGIFRAPASELRYLNFISRLGFFTIQDIEVIELDGSPPPAPRNLNVTTPIP